MPMHIGKSPRKMQAQAKRRRNSIIAIILILILIIILLLVGIWYVWWSGKNNVVKQDPLPEKVVQPIQEKAKAEPIGPVSVSEQTFTTPVQQGGNASLAIRTRAEAACNVTVTYDGEKSNDAGLLPKTADEFGTVQWTWTVESSRPVGKWPVDITCGLGKESGYHRVWLEITPKS